MIAKNIDPIFAKLHLYYSILNIHRNLDLVYHLENNIYYTTGSTWYSTTANSEYKYQYAYISIAAVI